MDGSTYALSRSLRSSGIRAAMRFVKAVSSVHRRGVGVFRALLAMFCTSFPGTVAHTVYHAKVQRARTNAKNCEKKRPQSAQQTRGRGIIPPPPRKRLTANARQARSSAGGLQVTPPRRPCARCAVAAPAGRARARRIQSGPPSLATPRRRIVGRWPAPPLVSAGRAGVAAPRRALRSCSVSHGRTPAARPPAPQTARGRAVCASIRAPASQTGAPRLTRYNADGRALRSCSLLCWFNRLLLCWVADALQRAADRRPPLPPSPPTPTPAARPRARRAECGNDYRRGEGRAIRPRPPLAARRPPVGPPRVRPAASCLSACRLR